MGFLVLSFFFFINAGKYLHSSREGKAEVWPDALYSFNAVGSAPGAGPPLLSPGSFSACSYLKFNIFHLNPLLDVVWRAKEICFPSPLGYGVLTALPTDSWLDKLVIFKILKCTKSGFKKPSTNGSSAPFKCTCTGEREEEFLHPEPP